MPLYYKSDQDLIPAAHTIDALSKLTSNIVILINSTAREYVEQLKSELAQEFPDYPVFVINESRSISRLADDNKTIDDLFKAGGLNKYLLRNIRPQLSAFYKYLDKHK